MKKGTILLLVSLILVSLQTVASGYTLPAKFKMKLANAEVFDATLPVTSADGKEDLWGIANITDIYDITDNGIGTRVWVEGDANEHLRLIFWGLDIISWTTDPGPFTTQAATSTTTVNTSGGSVAIPFAGADLWLWQDSPSTTLDTANLRTGFNNYETVSDLNNLGIPVKQVSLQFMPGIDPLSSTILTNGTTFGSGTPPTGHGAGYFDVVTGGDPVITAKMDSNSFSTTSGPRDLFFEFNFRTPGVDGFNLLSDDPVLGATTPEPNTILFFGIGLIGLGAFVRRRIAR